MAYEFKHERIMTLRKSHDLSLEAMAAKLGKPKQLVCVWESGVSAPNLGNLLHICNTFQVPPDFFIIDVCDTVADMKEAA